MLLYQRLLLQYQLYLLINKTIQENIVHIKVNGKVIDFKIVLYFFSII